MSMTGRAPGGKIWKNRKERLTLPGTTPLKHVSVLSVFLCACRLLQYYTMEKIIRFGFQSIYVDFPRKSVRKKGENLYQSGHVFDLEEKIVPFENTIRAKVLPQTSVRNSPYKVTLKVNKARRLQGKTCECKAGKSFCKHVAAVVIAINDEEPQSCTSMQQKWGRPSLSVQEKYKKGHRMEDMFPSKNSVMPVGKNPPIICLEALPPSCCLKLMLDAEKITEDENVSLVMLNAIIDQVVKQTATGELIRLIEIIHENQKNSKYFVFETTGVSNDSCKIHLKLFQPKMCSVTEHFYKEKVSVTVDCCKNIFLDTRGQSSSSKWYAERKIRFSASKAHRILVRKADFERLCEDLYASTSINTPAIRYGLKMEEEACHAFSTLHNKRVYDAGLLIYYPDPWLCCSADGIILDGNKIELLEIKCPFSCKDKCIVDYDLQTSNCSYLYFSEGNLNVKSNHLYYTQIQISLLVLGAEQCYFFVYSRKQSVTVMVKRNESFQIEAFSKLKLVYFNYFLKYISSV